MRFDRIVEKVTARVAVSLDGRRPLRGPLARPCKWVIDRVYALSLAAHHRRWVAPVITEGRTIGCSESQAAKTFNFPVRWPP